MGDIAFPAAILAGKLDAWRSAMARCTAGNPDYVASRNRLGIRREAAWLHHTPAGDVAVVHIEADDVGAALRRMGTSTEPFDVWFRDAVKAVHGFDLAEPAPPAEQVVDYRAAEVGEGPSR